VTEVLAGHRVTARTDFGPQARYPHSLDDWHGDLAMPIQEIPQQLRTTPRKTHQEEKAMSTAWHNGTSLKIV